MTIRYFLAALLASMIFFAGVNIFQKELENFIFLGFINYSEQDARYNQELLTARLGASSPPARSPNKSVPGDKTPKPNPDSFSAKSILVATLNDSGPQKILFAKNQNLKLPIASLAKLMTAEVVMENFDLGEEIIISKEAVAQDENFGQLKSGEKLTAGDLLYLILMESSNDAAWALAESIGVDSFVNAMNRKAQGLAMTSTLFTNPAGLDPDLPAGPIGYSSAEDLAVLAAYMLRNHPIIWEISVMPSVELYSPDQTLHHRIINTNELISVVPRLAGGKTGWTPKAKGCLILIQKALNNRGYLIYIILGSDDRFGEMRELVDWVNESRSR